ncbi:dephospho-CoA kinase [Planctomycetes bacterium K23_9]|uniref:Dephospho-CoA kinase n=1 Tax=Stieleria marina TaxID=1930275 RepID=A0A517NRU1_9BACT|nr:Dephospho-CoA kinase [Planctomycetes bacterium K23_9]
MILLGLVGTPASGKSTVATHLRSKGAFWINADLTAREVLTQSDVIEQLVKRFGDLILGDDGLIDRARLAERVFGDEPEKNAALKFLESVVHPITRQRITDQIKVAADKQASVTILDIPLLFESHWDLSCDVIWCIDAPVESRIQWASTRGWTAEELHRREFNQLGIAEKRRLSNQTVYNQATLGELFEKLDLLWSDVVTIRTKAFDTPDPGHCLGD